MVHTPLNLSWTQGTQWSGSWQDPIDVTLWSLSLCLIRPVPIVVKVGPTFLEGLVGADLTLSWQNFFSEYLEIRIGPVM